MSERTVSAERAPRAPHAGPCEPADEAARMETRLAEVKREIERLLRARSLRAEAYGAHFAALWKTAAECAPGGKLLRPRLLLGAFDALVDREEAGILRDAAARIAAGIELLHLSFLMHDDVIDGDLLRRGRPNLIGAMLRDRDPAAFDAQAPGARPVGTRELHWAHANGILMGDLLLSAAHQVFAREPLPQSVRLRLLDLLDRTITESVVGEQLDVGLSDGVVPADLAIVLEMSRLKTATYTFELPLRAAAILTGAEPGVERAVGKAGRHLGVAFQLQDDLLSTFGRPEEHGKDPFSDLREGKETAIVAYARMTSAWPAIEPCFGRSRLTEEEGSAMRDLLVACGAERFVRSLVDEQLRACRELTSSPDAPLPPGLARFFGRLVASIEDRRS